MNRRQKKELLDHDCHDDNGADGDVIVCQETC
jgi:hypothetical protein